VVTTAAVAVERDGGTQPDVVLPAGGATTSPTPSPLRTPDPLIVTDPASIVSPRPGVTSTAIPKDTGGEYIAIVDPASGAAINGPAISVSGVARVFEAQLTVDVSQNGVVVHTAHVTADAGAPSKAPWSVVLHLAPGNYKLEAYELSAKGDGTKAATDTIWITVR
jgi:hypothetical protein